MNEQVLEKLDEDFDEAASLIENSFYVDAVRRLGRPLAEAWARIDCLGQAQAAREMADSHQLKHLVRQDPYTERAAAKPRGYAGDAVMLDYVYAGTPPDGTTPVGRGMFMATTRSSMGLSVTFRRSLLRSYFDECILTTAGARASSAPTFEREAQ